MKKLQGKVVIVTGASSGLGKQAAIRLAEDGASLAICARTEAKLMETKAACEAAGADVLAAKADVAVFEDLKAFVDQAIARFGVIDVLVNNAISIPSPKAFDEYGNDILDATLKSGLYSVWHMMQLCFPYLKESRGVVVNFGAGASTIGLAGWTAYSATKGAVGALSMSLAREWGPLGIRVNIINPAGMTDSIDEKMKARDPELMSHAVKAMSQNALRRVGDPYSDVAPAVSFLASDDSKFVTGQTLNVDGGIIIHA